MCRRAGVNKGSFYHFFPSKQDLALAVIDGFGAAHEDQLAQVLETDAPGVIVAPTDLANRLVAEKGTEATWAGAAGTRVEVQAGEQVPLPLIFTDDGSQIDACNNPPGKTSVMAVHTQHILPLLKRYGHC